MSTGCSRSHADFQRESMIRKSAQRFSDKVMLK